MTIDLSSDLDVLTATIWAEARGEGYAGQRAVGSVIRNRALYAQQHTYPQFGNGTIRDACLAPWQFSCWNAHDPNRAEIEALDFTKSDAALTQCLVVAHGILNGSVVDNTSGCLFYKTVVTPWPKDWGPRMSPDAIIGTQAFYKLGMVVPPPVVPELPVIASAAPVTISAPVVAPKPSFWQRMKAWFV